MPSLGSPQNYGKLIITGIISLVVGVGSGLLLDYFRSNKPRLEYQIVTSSVFAGPKENIAILALEVENSGPKELEDFACQIEWEGAALQESRVAGFLPGKYAESAGKNRFSIEAPYINPTERVRADLLLALNGSFLQAPTIEVRAKGVVGTEKALQDNEKQSVLLPTLLSVMTALATASAILPILRRTILKKRVFAAFGYTGNHSDDQRDVTAYVLDVTGLHDAASKIRSISREISYWSISDELTQSFINEGIDEKVRKLAAAFEYLLEYAAIAETSCFLVNYNLARLYLKLGDVPKAKAKLREAEKENHSVICKRIAMVPELVALTEP